MILNTKDLYQRIFVPSSIYDPLSVIPTPDKKHFLENTGASVDLRLGRWFRTMKQSNLPLIDLEKENVDKNFTKEHFVRFDGKFILHPGKFVLGMTLEWLTVPGDLAGHVTGKSSLGRRGLIIETAAGIQPGYAGCLTLEFANVGEIPIALKPGMKICQIFFHQTLTSNGRSRSQFKGSRKPELGSATYI